MNHQFAAINVYFSSFIRKIFAITTVKEAVIVIMSKCDF